MRYRYLDTPWGQALLAGDAEGLRHFKTQQGPSPAEPAQDWRPASGELDDACRQLDEYFAGQRRRFDLRMAPRGTPFQQAVWKALGEIPYGTTINYRQLAAHVDRPRAVRAVGTANGANPLWILVPCHRVIGSDGSLAGYAGGLPLKSALLRLEGWQAPEQLLLT